jgi:hypothetical protein
MEVSFKNRRIDLIQKTVKGRRFNRVEKGHSMNGREVDVTPLLRRGPLFMFVGTKRKSGTVRAMEIAKSFIFPLTAIESSIAILKDILSFQGISCELCCLTVILHYRKP